MKTPSLNHAYKLVWSHVHNAWIAVSETTTGRGKSRSAKRLIKRAVAATTASALLLSTGGALADQTGGQVVSGSGSISQTANTTTINQHSQHLGLTWDTFNINANQTVNFVQPNAAALAVNRIFDTNGSKIMGNLNANGQVWLINPNGVFFGAGSQVNVGSILASTLNPLSNPNDTEQLFGNGGTGSVINQGNITAANGGYVAMLGNKVINEGVITAQMGTVALGAGSQVSLQFNGNQLLGLTVNESTLNNLAENKQLIKADGGAVYMSAGAKDSVLASVVNNEGVIEAKTVQNKDGKIILLGGMTAGTTKVAGTLDASAAQGDGGFIETSAANVQIAANTKVTTNADNGNTGTWLIDPTNFNIEGGSGAKTTSSIGADTLATNLGTNNVQIQTAAASTEDGDINVNAAVTWASNNDLTLTAHNDININQDITATGATAKLNLEYGQANVASGNTSTYNVNAKVNLQAGDNFSTKLGSDGTTTQYKVITKVKTASGEGLQGINGNLAGNYVLGADIDASATSTWNSGAGFNPIGDNTTKFTGELNGLGHTVNSLMINRPSLTDVGLFGVTDGATISNVGLVGGSVTGFSNVGALVGRSTNSSLIKNSYASSTVNGKNNNTGGLIGASINSIISNSYAIGKVTAVGDSAGGLVGYINNSTIKDNSYATGEVSGDENIGGLVGNSAGGKIVDSHAEGKASGDHNIGGLVGYQGGVSSITNSYAIGEAIGGYRVGGLVGSNQSGSISKSYATGKVTGTVNGNGGGTGGLVGESNGGTISDSHATGAVTGPYRVGGLVGYNFVTNITNSYSDSAVTGSIVATPSRVGGLVGDNGFDNNNGGDIDKSYATGIVKGGANVGGLVGISKKGAITNSYATGAVTGTNINVGGLVGYNSLSNISNAYATGAVNGNGNTGGLVGYASFSNISNAYATGTVTASGERAGGLIGYSQNSTINNTYATGAVNGNDYTGGLVGYNFFSEISNAYATGSVKGGNRIGGLIGYHFRSKISNAYATGAVTGTANTGGLLGSNKSSTITNGYYADTTGQTDTGKGERKTIAQLAAALPTGFASADWGNGSNQTTPYLLSHRGFDTAGPTYLGTDATAATPYQAIINVNQLQAVNNDLAGQYVLGNDIDARATMAWNANAGFNPLGNSTTKFTGVFNGLGHVVDSLIINRGASDNIGLFGVNAGTLSNIGITDAFIWGGKKVGILAGSNQDGSISNSYTSGKVDGDASTGDYVGGLVGHNYANSSISNSYSNATVKGDDKVGGLVGSSSGTISNAYATGSVTGDYDVGGLVGSAGSNSTISNAYATGPVTGNGSVGGLVGYISRGGTISNAYATGSVSGTDSVGGLVGYNFYGTISNAYATGAVTGGSGTGGLVGNANRATISNAYATGAVNGASDTGGLVGLNDNATITNGYYTDTTGQNDARRGEKKTIAQLAAALPTGFDSAVWGNGSNQTTPYLLSHGGFDTAGPTYLGTDATAATPYQAIINVNQLQAVENDLSNNYVLGNNIDASATSTWNSGAGFNPLGDRTTPFTGKLDGLGHTVNGLVIKRPTEDYVGLFGAVSGTTIQNIGMVDGSVSGQSAVGGLIGVIQNSVVRHTYATGIVTGNYTWAGGLVGFSEYGSEVANSYATGDVDGGQKVGGLIGHNEGKLTNVYAMGKVTGTESYVGGLVGDNLRSASINNAYAIGNVRGKSQLGGLIGSNNGEINNAYATGNVTGSGFIVGGLVGENYSLGKISNTYATGNVTGTVFGGLIGHNSATAISNSFWNSSNNTTGIGGGRTTFATGKTSSELMQLSTFTTAGWDIDDQGGTGKIWRIYEGHTSPLLRSFMTTLDLTGNNKTTTYDGTTQSISYTLPAGTDASLVQGSTSGKNAGTYNSGLYSSQQGYDIKESVLLIQKKAFSLAGTRAYDATAIFDASDLQLTGLIGSEQLTLSIISPMTVTDKNVGSNKVPVSGGFGITDGTGGGLVSNYQFGGFNFAITPKAIVVAASANNKTYDATTSATLSSLSSAGVIAGDSVNFSNIAANFSDPNAGIGKTVNVTGIGATGTDAGNYSFNNTATTLANIDKATLTYVATPNTMTAGTTPSLTGNVTGFVAGENLASATTGGLQWTTAGNTTQPGTYDITGSGLTAINYLFVQAAANPTALTVQAGSIPATISTTTNSNNLLPSGTSAAPQSQVNTVDVNNPGTASGGEGEDGGLINDPQSQSTVMDVAFTICNPGDDSCDE